MKSKKDSSAIALLRIVWVSCNEATGFSYGRLNHSMALALNLAIGGGFRFAPDDFAVMERDFRFDYWGSQGSGGFAESFYSLACAASNISAAQAFEKWKGREPIIADDVDHSRDYRYDWYQHGGGQRARDRICVECRFPWNGEYVTVTSMRSEPTRAVACSYTQTDGSRSKTVHPYTITPAAIIANRAKRKQEKPDV